MGKGTPKHPFLGVRWLGSCVHFNSDRRHAARREVLASYIHGVFGAFAIWEFARILLDGRGLIRAATTGVSFIWFFALSALYVALAPREGPTIYKAHITVANISPTLIPFNPPKYAFRVNLRDTGNLMANNYFAYLVGKITKSPLSERDTDLVLTYLTNCIERYDVITAKHSEESRKIILGYWLIPRPAISKRDQSNEVEALLYATNSEISQIVGGVALLYIFRVERYDDEEINGFWQGVYCSYYIVSLAVAHPCPGADNKTRKISGRRWR